MLSEEKKLVFQNVENWNIAKMRDLLDERPDLVDAIDQNNNTPLILSTTYGDAYMVRLLISRNVNADIQNSCGSTALMTAVILDKVEIIRRLTQYGADLNIKNNDEHTAFILSLLHKKDHISDFLIDQNANVNNGNIEGDTPLMWCLWKGKRDLAIRMIDHGANLQTLGNDGKSVLGWAISHGDEELITYMLGKGVKCNARMQGGLTALMLACRCRTVDIMLLLLSHGAHLDLVDDVGRDALHHACLFGQLHNALELCSRGMNPLEKTLHVRLNNRRACGHKDSYRHRNHPTRKYTNVFISLLTSIYGDDAQGDRTSIDFLRTVLADNDVFEDYRQQIMDCTNYRRLFLERTLPKISEILSSSSGGYSRDMIRFVSEKSELPHSLPYQDVWATVLSFLK